MRAALTPDVRRVLAHLAVRVVIAVRGVVVVGAVADVGALDLEVDIGKRVKRPKGVPVGSSVNTGVNGPGPAPRHHVRRGVERVARRLRDGIHRRRCDL